ncbi:hypothetical protein CDL15_Pgr005416 [Punica granatum]|uniref:Uncharacterized protein n=1 Tax=Punica granatum TaxID=22663 RepID=A0A218XE83_PUNGR|nr:hypothetical protein CDL15_Pgr005416 [Punica granatum]
MGSAMEGLKRPKRRGFGHTTASILISSQPPMAFCWYSRRLILTMINSSTDQTVTPAKNLTQPSQSLDHCNLKVHEGMGYFQRKIEKKSHFCPHFRRIFIRKFSWKPKKFSQPRTQNFYPCA